MPKLRKSPQREAAPKAAGRSRRKSPLRDFQREEVYAWEGQFFSAKYSTAPARWFRKTLVTLCGRYGVPVPKIEQLPDNKNTRHTAAICWYERGTLYFREGYRSILTLCHELAHWILDCYGYGDFGCHGPRFVGVYLHLLASAYVVPLDLSIPSARQFGLKFRDPVTECGPGTLERYLERARRD